MMDKPIVSVHLLMKGDELPAIPFLYLMNSGEQYPPEEINAREEE